MMNPTGLAIRKQDGHGSGEYGAPRGGRMHKGTDYVCFPGQDVVSPIDGMIIRKARPYSKGEMSGVLIQGKHVAIKMFYMQLGKDIKPGRSVQKGDIIGTAQDVSKVYPGMTPHVHLQIDHLDPAVLTEFI